MADELVCCRCGGVKARADFVGRVSKGNRVGSGARGTCRDCANAYKRSTRRQVPGGLKRHWRGAYIRTSSDQWPEATWRALEISNARDAWRYWLKIRAPRSWLHAYHEAGKRHGRGLAPAEKWRRYYARPEFRLGHLLRMQRRKAQRGRHGEAIRAMLKGCGTGAKLAEWFGYSVPDLRRHLERQFGPGMSWDAFQQGRIHIDHIVPLSSFDLSDPVELKAAWALSNLRPLSAEANMKKGAARVLLL